MSVKQSFRKISSKVPFVKKYYRQMSIRQARNQWRMHKLKYHQRHCFHISFCQQMYICKGKSFLSIWQTLGPVHMLCPCVFATPIPFLLRVIFFIFSGDSMKCFKYASQSWNGDFLLFLFQISYPLETDIRWWRTRLQGMTVTGMKRSRIGV